MKHSETSSNRALTREELWRQLENAIALRSTQDQILWTLFGIFWASNAVLLVALFTTGKLPDPAVGLVVAVVGVALCTAWALIRRRALGHLVRDEKLMDKIERALNIDPTFAVGRDVNHDAYRQYVGRGPSARRVMTACTVLGPLLWAVFGVYFVAVLLRGGHP